MNTTTLANRLGLTPKNLRRRIRKSGLTFRKELGEYVFSEQDYETLKGLFFATPEETDQLIERLDLDMSKPLDTSILYNYWSNSTSRKAVKDKWELRQARLRQAIAETL